MVNRAIAAFADRFPPVYRLLTARLRWLLAGCALLFAVVAFGLYAQLLYRSDGLVTTAGPMIGGDFVVFRFAATVAGTPQMSAIYEMANLKAMLRATYAGDGDFNFAWMYPPTMSLLVAPFRLSSYLVAFMLWVVIFGGVFLVTVSRLWTDRWALFFLAASPAVFQAIVTGQNGFLTATLIALVGAFGDRRPVVAGVAAGLLTVKPQLGLLIPVAFLAAGCWRAIAVAAVTALFLAATSVLAFGTDVWVAFVHAIAAHGARMGAEGFPFEKLVTPFGLATMLNVPPVIASAVQIAATCALVGYVFFVWRRVEQWDLRLAALATAAVLSTPYAFYYELVIVAPAMMLIARRAVDTGWLRGERLALVAIWTVPLMMPGDTNVPAFPTCAIGAIVAFLIAARRTLPAAGIGLAADRWRAPAVS